MANVSHDRYITWQSYWMPSIGNAMDTLQNVLQYKEYHRVQKGESEGIGPQGYIIIWVFSRIHMQTHNAFLFENE